MAIGLMDWLNSIGTSGEDLTEGNDNAINDYPPFIINKGMAQAIDTIMFANEMNKRPWLDEMLQYKFLLGSVSKKKRYNKWVKAEPEANQEDITMVSNYYKVNEMIASSYITLLKPDELEKIRSSFFKGGDGKSTEVKTKAKKVK